ncbi:hypothetical protein [Thermococcus sp.]
MKLALPAVTGMFIFGGKKEKSSKEKETTVPKSLRDKVSIVVMDHGKGLYYLLSRATPEQDVAKITKILDHNPLLGQPNATQRSEYKKNTSMKHHQGKN